MISARGKLILVLTAAFLIASPAFIHGAVVDKIVVVVNNEVITQGEIDRILMPLYYKFKTMYQGEDLLAKLDQARQAILGQLIDEKLMLGEAKKLNIEVDEKEVAAKLSEVQKRFGSKEMLEKALAEQRLTLKDLKAKYREQLMTRKLIDGRVGIKIVITPVEVSEYYRKHSEEFVQAEEVKLRNILIKPTASLSPEKAMELAQDISRMLKNGADFAELARTYSEGPGAADGGAVGYKKRGELLPEVEAAVFNLKEGEATDMIETSLGYLFFKVDEKRPAKNMSLAEARRQIEDAIYMEKSKEKMKGWMEGLKKHAYIAFR